jgi:hypothetical protein
VLKQGVIMGWADDMYDAGYTEEHGGLMDDVPSMRSRPKESKGKKSGPGSRWSEHDRNQMVDMYKADVSIKIIAKKLHRTPLAIACQLYNKSEISVSIKDKFLEDRSFDTCISTINRNVYNHNKITRKENTKVRKFKIEEDKVIEDCSFGTSIRTINRDVYNHEKITRKENTKVHRFKMKILGIICVAIAVFGWTGYWFAGSGFAALIALGFLFTGISLISSDKE